MNKNEILMTNARQIATSNPFERLAFSSRKITDEEILDFVRENLVIDKDDNGNVVIKEVQCSIDGHLFGDVNGDVRGNVVWDVYGKVLGKVHG